MVQAETAAIVGILLPILLLSISLSAVTDDDVPAVKNSEYRQGVGEQQTGNGME